MNFDQNDPRITAYALGETLEGKDRDFIESIREHPEFDRSVAEIRRTAGLLQTHFADERNAVAKVSASAVLEQASAPETAPRSRSFWRRPATWVTAAGVPLAALFAFLLLPSRTAEEKTYALRDANGEDTGDSAVRYRRLDVEIPEERIEGTPQPLREPNLEPAPTQAPQILVATRDQEVSNVANSSSDPRGIAGELGAIEIDLKQADPGHSAYGRGSAAFAVAGDESSSATTVTQGPVDAFAPSAKPAPPVQESRPMVVSSLGFADDAMPAPSGTRPLPRDSDDRWNREGYDRIEERDFVRPTVEPLSTFSIDVDTASYANVRRILNGGQLPPPDAVRIEELVNYFTYDYPVPEGGDPFSVTTEVGSAPWQSEHLLVRIGLKGYEVPWDERPSSNLVFLVDVSGSMSSPNKLGLVKQALTELTHRFDRRDRVAIVVYAGRSGLVLPSTSADNQETIAHALENLNSGGSTNGGEGIELAYQVAQKHFVAGGNNRVILCTDGDFNVGVSDRGQLTRLIEAKAKSGVYLSICGFGMGNYRDDMMETLSNKGNGNYAYIDSIREARKVFGQNLSGTLLTIAKDVKIQVEFNPAEVAAYRLIGYENRALAAKDFNDDTKDAGEIGAGHTVTALYEIVPTGTEVPGGGGSVDPLKYQGAPQKAVQRGRRPAELMTVKLRYKAPDADESTLMETVVGLPTDETKLSADFRFASAVTEFGLLLRDSAYAPEADWSDLIQRARSAIGQDPGGHRIEFVDLATKAQQLQDQSKAGESGE